METYLFKFSVCLVIFCLVYMLFLERQNMHRFKRFYLLGALTLALIIPKLTITEYVEPMATTLETAPTFMNIDPSFLENSEEPSFFDLETTLWFIYGIGVLLFAIRFFNNLFQMQRRISKNENIRNRSFIYVLLQENLIPHSFFKYIFFNKTRYESNHIPKEVVLHEETHAKQLHSLDIIILELLQIAFWFHPLIYILKHHVKLNHEFLADQAVLQQGSDAKTYQTILLQFSSNTQNHQLSSAINYSSIKKRFTVMKTQTSKTRIWLSTLLVLPIISVLFYNFAERVEVVQEKEKLQKNSIVAQEKPLTEKEISAYNAWAKKIHSESTKLSDNATFYPPINEQDFIKFSEIYKRMSTQQEDQSIEFPFPGLVVKDSEQEKATPQQVAEYNAWAKKINTAIAKANVSNGNVKEYPIIKRRDLEKYKHIYNIMTAEQKQTAEPFPQGPPPPPPAVLQNNTVKSNPIEINGATYYYNYTQENGKMTYYDQYGKVVDINQIPPPPPIPNNATPEQKAKMKKATDAYMKANPDKVGTATTTEGEVLEIIEIPDDLQGSIDINGETLYYTTSHGKTTYFNRYGKEVKMDNLPPPPPAPAEKINSYSQEIPIMVILINRKGQLLVDDELGTTESIESHLKKLSKSFDNSRAVYVKYDPSDASDKVLKDVKTLIREHDFKIIFVDASQDTLQPPPPPAKPNKSKGGPNTEETQSIYNPSFLEFLEDMEKQGATFYLDHKKITAEKAKSIAKNNKGKQMDMTTKLDDNGKYIVLLSTPIVNKTPESILPIINGRTIKAGEISMTINEIRTLKLTLPNAEITAFKLKIPGIKTEQIKGNEITNVTLKNLKSAKVGDYITLFDIKDSKSSKISSVTIEIVESH